MPGALVPPRAAYGWFLFKLRSMGDGSVLSDDRWCAVSACAARQLWMAASAWRATRTERRLAAAASSRPSDAPGARVRGSR